MTDASDSDSTPPTAPADSAGNPADDPGDSEAPQVEAAEAVGTPVSSAADPADPAAPKPGAHCAAHVDRPATLSCLRCGDFVCDDCRHGGKLNICERCAASGVPEHELNFPFADGRWTWSELLDWNLKLFKKHGLMLCAVLLIGGALAYAVGMLAMMPVMFSMVDFSASGRANNLAMGNDPRFLGLMLLSSIPLYLLGIYLFTGLKRLCFDVHLGRRLEVQRLFIRPGIALKALGAYFLIYLFPMLFGQGQQLAIRLLEINPLDPIVIGSSFAVSFFVCFYHGPLLLTVPHIIHRPDEGVIAAIRTSWSLTRGRRIACSLLYFGIGVLSWFGIFACCVGVVIAPVFLQLLEVGLYLAIRAERRGTGEL